MSSLEAVETQAEKVKANRISFSSKEVSNIARLFGSLENEDTEVAIQKIAETVPKFNSDVNAARRKLESMGLIDKNSKRHSLDEDEVEAIGRAVDALYDQFQLTAGTARERAVNLAIRQNLAARVKRDKGEAATEEAAG